MKSVRKEQMLLIVARDNPLKAAKLLRIETLFRRLQQNRAHRQHEGMSIGAPDRTRIWHCKLRRLEGDQAEFGCGSCRAANCRTVGNIAPKPFPSDERSVGFEER